MKALIVNSQGKKIKTITGSTNLNGYFWQQFNRYCKNKGYIKGIFDDKYLGGLAWSNGNDILEMVWVNQK